MSPKGPKDPTLKTLKRAVATCFFFVFPFFAIDSTLGSSIVFGKRACLKTPITNV